MTEARRRKRCVACRLSKPRAAFYRRTASPDGLDARCRECRSAYFREWTQRHRRYYNALAGIYRDENRTRLRAYQRA
jgi:hypothetical protein